MAISCAINRSGKNAVPLPRSKSSILRWTNPTQGTIYGNVFVWTKDGQAKAVGSVVKGYSPFTTMSIELQSFSRDPLRATYDGDEIWAPEVADVEFVSLEGAPANGARLRQMRAVSTGDGYEWQYAIGRMNGIRFEVRRNDQLVWKGDKLAPPWRNVRRPEKSYFFLGLGNVGLESGEVNATPNAKPARN